MKNSTEWLENKDEKNLPKSGVKKKKENMREKIRKLENQFKKRSDTQREREKTEGLTYKVSQESPQN